MADEFDASLGTDPFGGGSEGLPDIPSPQTNPSLSFPNLTRGEDPGAPRSGLSGIANRLFGGGDKVASGDLTGGLAGIAKGIAPLAQTGLAAFGIKNQVDAAGQAKRQGQNLAQAQQIQRESAQPLQQFGSTQLNRAQAGQVDPAIQAQIDQWAQAQKIKMQQFFAHSGIADSTMLQSALADIDAKAVAMKAGNLQMMEQLGIGALSAAGNVAGQAGQTAQTEQSQLDTLIKEANAALAAMLA
jgi:hypothetical protein